MAPVDLDVRDTEKLTAVVRALVTLVGSEHGRDAWPPETSVDLRLEIQSNDDVVAWLSVGAEEVGQAELAGARSYRLASLLDELAELCRQRR